MNKINSILIAAIMLSATLSFTAENNIRYEEIAVAFSHETNSFDPSFVQNENDIAIITQHKNDLLKKVDGYKKSWMPTLLKIVGTQLGIDAGLRTAYLFLAFASPSKYAINLLHLLSYITIPTKYIRLAITRPMHQALNELLKEGSINATDWKLATISVGTATILLTTKIARYLLDKAYSYTDKIALLEQEVQRDNAMISCLE